MLNGYARDTLGIYRLNFPTFCWGRYGQDSGVRATRWSTSAYLSKSGAVRIDPGDIIFGDIDARWSSRGNSKRRSLLAPLKKARGEKKSARRDRGRHAGVRGLPTIRHYVTESLVHGHC